MFCGDEFGRLLVCAEAAIAEEKIKNKAGIRRFRRIIGLPLSKSSTRFVWDCVSVYARAQGLGIASRAPVAEARNAGEASQHSAPRFSFDQDQNFNSSVPFAGMVNVTMPFESVGLPTTASLLAELNSHCVPVPFVIKADKFAVMVTAGLPLLHASK